MASWLSCSVHKAGTDLFVEHDMPMTKRVADDVLLAAFTGIIMLKLV